MHNLFFKKNFFKKKIFSTNNELDYIISNSNNITLDLNLYQNLQFILNSFDMGFSAYFLHGGANGKPKLKRKKNKIK